MSILVLDVNDERYGISMDAVREVLPRPALTPLPGAPAAMIGLFNARGEIVPLFDIAALLDVGRLSELEFVTVLSCSGGLAGLGSSTQPRTVGEAPSDPAASAPHLVVEADGGLVTMLDVEAVLAPERASRRRA